MKDLVTCYETNDGIHYIELATNAIQTKSNINQVSNKEHIELSENFERYENPLTLSEVLDFLLDDNCYSNLAKWEVYYNPWFHNAASFRKTITDSLDKFNLIQDSLRSWISINDSISIISDPSENGVFYIHEDVYKMIESKTAES